MAAPLQTDSPPADDAALVRQAQQGDYEAFEQLVSRHERRLYALAWHLTRDHHDAQDAVQNTLLSVMEHLDQFRGDSSFKTWVTRILVNDSLKLVRRRRGARAAGSLSSDGDSETDSVEPPQFIADWREDPQKALDSQELRQVLDEGIATLNDGQRLVFVLRDVEGLNVAETAKALNIRPGNVKVRLLRARLALREYLTGRFGDPARRKIPDHAGHDHDALLALVRGRKTIAEGAEI